MLYEVITKMMPILREETKMMNTSGLYTWVLAIAMATTALVPVARAQEANTPTFGTTNSMANLSYDELPAEVKILQSIEKEIKEKYKKQIYSRSNVPSLFFTSQQHALLRRNNFV